MSDIKWIKVITDIFADEKIKLIKSMPEGRTLVLIWFQLLIQAGKTNASGWIYLSEGCAYTPAMFATLFNESQQMVELALNLFSSKPFEMIEISPAGLIYIQNWEKHQNVEGMDKIREQNRVRKIKHRERQKLLSRDSHVPSQQSHATDIDIELDKDIKKSGRFTPPQLSEIESYISEKGLSVEGKKFFDYFTEGNWTDIKGNKVKNWKQKLLTWSNKNGGNNKAGKTVVQHDLFQSDHDPHYEQALRRLQGGNV